jgi:hypothetical protein
MPSEMLTDGKQQFPATFSPNSLTVLRIPATAGAGAAR